MTLTERPLTFEQEYPKHSFAPLVALAVAVAAWAVRRRTAGRTKAAGAPVRPVAGGLTLSKHVAIAVTVTLAMAATSSHVRADASSRAGSDSIPTAALPTAPSAEVLASVVARYESDALDTYAQDMRAFGRSASMPAIPADSCTESRASGSTQMPRGGAAVSATRASLPAVARYIDPPAARKLFQGAEFNVRDGLDVYDLEPGLKTGSLLAVSKR